MPTQEEISFDFHPPVPVVRQLMREYADSLGVDLCFQNFELELAELPGRYAEPEGCLIVVWMAGTPAACGAFRRLSQDITGDKICEMKRLYVRPEYRGHSLGRHIAKELMARATAVGYRKMQLDTLPSMNAAMHLYRSLGFYEITPYYANPVPCSVFLEAALNAHSIDKG